jgi:hypothetical protein
MIDPARHVAHVVRVVVGAIAAAVLSSGCGSSNRLDEVALARVLPGQILPDHPELLTEVVCPAPIEKRTGTITTCTALLADAPVTIAVTQADDNGAVSAVLDGPVLDVTKSASTLAARLTKDLGVSTTIECIGPAVRVLVVGEVLACTARDPSLRSRALAVTVVDDQGTLAAELG